jgi:predicted transport protein
MNNIEKAEQTMIENIRKNTGKPLESWIDIVQKSGLAKHGDIVKFLKTEHGFTHGFANMVAHKAKGSDAASAGDSHQLIEKQYVGKENLRHVYEKIILVVKEFGGDIEISPKNSYVSLRRKRQFALVQPSTRTRLDIGLNIKDQDPDGKLEPSGSFNTMCTHRIRTENPDDVDNEVINWLRKAYDQAG